MKTQLTKEQHILRAVELGKKGQFGLTGLKVELEAKLNRGYTSGFEDTYDCQEWFNNKFVEMGLGTRVNGDFRVKHPLAYAYFYNDGSVDSELTFTISLKENENIFLVPKIVQLFKDFADEVGQGMDVRNAGMHMALIKDPNCFYGHDYRANDKEILQYNNFSRAMSPLMPALFLLGSNDTHSRSLHFRNPQVSTSKYSAIHYVGGALEFRVFETCYDNPDRVLDNFIVMRNCLRFWREVYMSPRLDRIARTFRFGNDNDETVGRFYQTVIHLDLLNAGLVKIKPAYLTVGQIKKERCLEVTKRTIIQKEKEVERDAKLSYDEYDNRFNWSIEVDTAREEYYALQALNVPTTAEQRQHAEELKREQVETFRQRRLASKLSLKQHITKTIKNHRENASGAWTLEIS